MLRTLATLSLLFAYLSVAASPVKVDAVRTWPATDYTRITFEASEPITYQLIVLKNPDRLAIDLENVEYSEILKKLPENVHDSDPYIKGIRTAIFKPGIVRIAIDLKQETKPSLFVLKPAGGYKYRMVLDIYPMVDPLMALLEAQNEEQKEPSQQEGGGWEQGAQLAVDDKTKTESKITEEKALAPEKLDRLITIAIDAGHGGEDIGARGAKGSYEKNITLAIAKKLERMVDTEPNMRGFLVRKGDYYIALRDRVSKARQLRADLFVSIHADAFTDPRARGSSVFALSERGATSAMARLMAQRENESDLIGGVNIDSKDANLARTLLDLSQTATISDSLKLGKAVLDHIGEINKLHKKSVEQAGFAVLKSPDIPSILVETAFISNPQEERKLNDSKYQTKMAEAILMGIKRYFSANPPLSRTNKLVSID